MNTPLRGKSEYRFQVDLMLMKLRACQATLVSYLCETTQTFESKEFANIFQKGIAVNFTRIGENLKTLGSINPPSNSLNT